MSELIGKHGGYRNLKSFQVSQLAFDVTVRFVEKYISRFSRTTDQMVQAARSGVQNIAEGSQASATSKKTELKLTQVARASLEELKLDYEDFLRQKNLPVLEPKNPVLIRFKQYKPKTVGEFAQWVAEERKHSVDEQRQARTNRDTESTANSFSQQSVSVGDSPCRSLSSACLAANGALSLLNLACYLLDRQVERLAVDFENEGGFTEKLYRIRQLKRNNRF